METLHIIVTIIYDLRTEVNFAHNKLNINACGGRIGGQTVSSDLAETNNNAWLFAAHSGGMNTARIILTKTLWPLGSVPYLEYIVFVELTYLSANQLFLK